MPIFFYSKFISLFLVGVLLVNCGGKAPTTEWTPSPSETLPVTSPTLTPTRQPASGPRLSTKTPQEPLEGMEMLGEAAPRLSSGWVTYTNPDFVRGIAVHDQQLWAATLGGVVVWDIKKKTHKLFTTWDGLVEIQGNDVVYCPSPEAQIIVAHPRGELSVYNLGLQKWSHIPISFEEGGTMTGVQTLFCDANNNRLIAGSSTEVAILDLNTMLWSRFGKAQGLKLESLLTIDVAGQSVWLADERRGAMLVMGDSVFPFNQSVGLPSGPIYDLAVASDQSIWLGYPSALIHYENGKWNPYSVRSQRGIPFTSIDEVELGSNNRIWVAGKNEGVCLFDPLDLICSPLYRGLKDYDITDLVVDEEGVPFLATDGGGVLGLYTDEVITFALHQETLAGNDVRSIAESQDGMLWVATDQGVNVLNPGQPNEPWQLMNPETSQPGLSHVTGLQPAANGMWFFHDQEPRASFFDGKDWLTLDSVNGLAGPVDASAVDWLGRLWLGTRQGIMLWSDSLLRPYHPPNDVSPKTIQAFLADQDGMWIGTDQGLLRFERYQWRSVLSEFSVFAIVEDQKGGLLLGTDKGLVRNQNNQSYVWVIDLGGEVVQDTMITSIAWDRAGHLWVGTDQKGLLMFNGEVWEQFDTSRGMPSNHIRTIYQDRLGTVWIVATTGHEGGALVRYVP